MKQILYILVGFLLFQSSILSQNNVGLNYDQKYLRLEFDVDPAINYIEGGITFYLEIKHSTDSLTFDMGDEIHVDSILFRNKTLESSQKNDILTVQLGEIIDEGVLDSISIYYQGEPDGGGFGSFVISTHDDTPVMWTLSEPYGAKDWWPCKQVLNDKVDSIDIFIIHPSKYKAASNGLLISEIDMNGKTKTHWKHRHAITPYLIAFAVTNYAVYSDYVPLGDNDSIQVLNYVYPESLDYAKENTPGVITSMQLYNNLFIDYPYKNEKYGHAQFGWGGGMEHQTMSFMVSFGYSLMAHELAHQWFGDYITCGSWSDIWLNEGFATYCDGLTIENELTDGNWLQWKKDKISSITSKSDGAVYAADTSSDSRIFSSRLSYNKGAMVLNTIRGQIGDDAFFGAIQNYLTDDKLINGFARTIDLQKHFESESGMDLSSVFEDWIYGEGFPYYTVSWGQGDDKKGFVLFEQRQSHSSVDFFELKVPVQFTGEGKDTILYFNNTENNQEFAWELGFKVDNVVLDPDKWIITKSPTIQSTNTVADDKSLVISPNPVNSKLTVITDGSFRYNRVNIYNVMGSKVKECPDTIISKEYTIDVKELEQGVYFLILDNGKKKAIKKFVKN